MKKQKNDKNVELVYELMGAITQTTEWNHIMSTDPCITQAEEEFERNLCKLKALGCHSDLIDALDDSMRDANDSAVDAAILYGIHVAFALLDVAGRIPDCSRYVLRKMGWEQNED